jgi:hypothetical protein
MSTFQAGDRVVYIGDSVHWRGQQGTVQAVVNDHSAYVTADRDGGTLLVFVANLARLFTVGERVVYTGEGHRNGHTGTVRDIGQQGCVVIVQADYDEERRSIEPQNLNRVPTDSERVTAALRDYPGYVTSSLREWLEQNTTVGDKVDEVVTAVRDWIAYQLSR